MHNSAPTPRVTDFIRRARCFLFVVVSAAGVCLDVSAAADRAVETYRRYAMEHDGDGGRGKKLFADATRLSCATCHSIDGTGSKVGPDLFSIGDQFARREIVEAILLPSSSIAVGYATTIIETTSNEEYSGVLKEATGDWVELAIASGARVRLRASEIRARRGTTVSLMPEGLCLGVSPQEFCDLVEYLVSLKEPAHSQRENRGMPEIIPEIPKPIALRPILKKPIFFEHSERELRQGIQTGLVALAEMPGVPNLFLVADQAGVIWKVDACGSAEPSLFANFTSEVFSARGPNGLLGLAFHPQFKQNRKYYLKHQVFEKSKIATVLVEKIAAENLSADSGKASRRLLTIEAVAEHHNGGCIQFGPDGFLYFGMGDSAPNHDPLGHGQDMRLLLGKMLRLDVNGRDNGEISIPGDNPFRNTPAARPEIWASGFREPWRFSFDSATGELWVADLGQERGDKVSIVRRGENHGWNVFQGFELFSKQYWKENVVYVPPIFSTRRRDGSAIVGGYVYRGDRASEFYGSYIFGDHVSKRIWALEEENRTLKRVRQIATAPQSITDFAMDRAGNIFVLGYQGMIYELPLRN